MRSKGVCPVCLLLFWHYGLRGGQWVAPSVSEQREECGDFPETTAFQRYGVKLKTSVRGCDRARASAGRLSLERMRVLVSVLPGHAHSKMPRGLLWHDKDQFFLVRQFFESLAGPLAQSANRPGQSRYYYLHPTSRPESLVCPSISEHFRYNTMLAARGPSFVLAGGEGRDGADTA